MKEKLNTLTGNTPTGDDNYKGSGKIPEYESDIIKPGQPNPGHFDIEFSVNKTHGTGNDQIKLILKAKHTAIFNDKILISRYPNQSEVTTHKIKTKKKLVIRIDNKIVKTIPVEYIPSNKT